MNSRRVAHIKGDSVLVSEIKLHFAIEQNYVKDLPQDLLYR